ncbi:MAG: SRPBCC family protein [Deltaproteobacteria bacterium]|nr:SRPBCC family protein [Deltaproteobacteria bacterium]
MIKVEITFLVDKPIEHVFDLIGDISGYQRWAPDKSNFFIENKITSEGPIGQGTTYLDRLRWGGKAIGKIVEYRPPSEIAFEQKTLFGIPVFQAEFRYALKALRNSTEVIHSAEAVPHVFFKLFEPILSHIVRTERERTCRAIKGFLEQKERVAGPL